MVFIVFAMIAFSFIPFMKKAFSKTSDDYIVAEMNRVQAEMYFYKLENNNFKYACISSNVSMLISNTLYELGSGLSCTSDAYYNNLSLYTVLNSGSVYCIDSSNFQGYIDTSFNPMGYCSK
jgi:hypothetical protein